jgi:hypothetical protein
MATKEEIKQELIKQELNDAKARLDEATKDLKEWEKGEDDGKWLKKLRRKLDDKEWGEDEEQKKRWEVSVKKLEEKEARLVKDKDDWKKQVENLQNALVNYKEKGNGQIA